MLTINAQRLLDDLTSLSAIGATPDGGVNRPALSEADVHARAWFRERIEAGGFTFRQDGAANLSAVLPAAETGAKTLLLGSHLDSVPHGGRFDGALGTLAALEVLRTVREAGLTLPVHLEAIAFTDEEGAHISLMGSRAISGQLSATDLAHPHSDPASFAAGLERTGITPEGIQDARRDPAALAGYVELHIEQGTRLEQGQAAIGAVTSIVGIRSHWLTFGGQAGHAGTMPLPQRQDALWGAADFILKAKDRVMADFAPGTVNCGHISAAPGAFNIVPGEVRLTLEFRHGTEAQIDAMESALLLLARETAEAYGLTLHTEPVSGAVASQLDERVIAAIEGAADALGLRHTRLLSFAGHDAQAMSTITPSAMLFVPSVAGISHNPKEYTRDEDVINGANVLLHTVLALAQRR
jgi:N-carbamoyl-L-amino-acid hydrolase